MKKIFNVVNLHITEKCNYQCTYCYAVFKSENELELNEWKNVVDKVSDYFISHGVRGRINLAGGEPTIVRFLDELINYIDSKDIDVSIITNASRLTKERIDSWTDKVSMIGISIDSLDRETNLIIGRKQGQHTLDYENLKGLLFYIKSKGMLLKVNTVISKLNVEEDITRLYNEVGFDRIKLLQVRIQENCNEASKPTEINSIEFDVYVSKVMNKTHGTMIIETTDLIESSYVIIDPEGYLISNANKMYSRVGNILEETLEKLILKANLDINKFNERYELVDSYE